MTLKVGDKAPDFTGLTDNGERINLSEKLKEGPVVLSFYPKDETPGCTAEACSFRDNWEDIRKLGATVLGSLFLLQFPSSVVSPGGKSFFQQTSSIPCLLSKH